MKPYLLLLLIFSGCTKEASLQDRFINHNDYWAYYDGLESEFYSSYFRFNPNGNQTCIAEMLTVYIIAQAVIIFLKMCTGVLQKTVFCIGAFMISILLRLMNRQLYFILKHNQNDISF